MVIIIQEPEILVYCCIGHIIDNCFVIAVYKGRLGLGNLLVYHIATIVDGNMRNRAVML